METVTVIRVIAAVLALALLGVIMLRHKRHA